MEEFDCPILLIIFNRPKETMIMMERIRKQRPKFMYITADGPRNPKDVPLCEQSRQIATNIDWPCQVKTLFREHNLGCGRGVSEAITWFFQQVEYGIILEDDCVPSEFFFDFCSKLLKYYQNEEKVMMITGTNFISEHAISLGESYYFSNISNVWGWATWRRAWLHYDYNMSGYESFKKADKMKSVFTSANMQKKYYEIFERYLNNQEKFNTWDYQWQFTLMNQQGLAIVPKANLITNIGFDNNATHTKSIGKYSYMPTQIMADNIVHPKEIKNNSFLDYLYYQKVLDVSLFSKLTGKLLFTRKVVFDTLKAFFILKHK